MLQGKVALITGSTSGIGLEIAKTLAKDGAHVILNGFEKPDVIEKIQQDIETQFGVKTLYQGADLTNVTEIENMFAQINNVFGGIDILVNNAGMQFVSPICEFPTEKWDKIMALNLTASFHTSRLAIPYMKSKKWGRIVCVASAHALVASPFKSAYVAAKHGLAGLCKVIALEVAEFGITCNAICPGYVRTPLVESQIDDTAKARGITREEVIQNVMLGPQATKKFVETTEVAEFAKFLCQDAAASITGALLPIDGGWTTH